MRNPCKPASVPAVQAVKCRPRVVPVWSRRYARRVRFYGIVDEQTQEAVELYVRREDAERFLEDVRADDEDLAACLRLKPVDLDA